MNRADGTEAEDLEEFGARFFEDEEPESRREGASDLTEPWISDNWSGDDQ